MYKVFTSNAGHSQYSPGANSNGYKEHEIAREFNKLFIEKMKKQGFEIYDTTSEAKTSSLVLQEQVIKCNKIGRVKERLDISFHLNSSTDPKSTGVEVLYYDQKDFSSKVSKGISEVLGLKDRGAKERKELYFLRNTTAPAVLIELCFISNKDDMKKLLDNKEKVIDQIIFDITGKKTTTANTTEKTYKVQVGSYKEKKNAEEMKKLLESKGFSCFIKYE